MGHGRGREKTNPISASRTGRPWTQAAHATERRAPSANKASAPNKPNLRTDRKKDKCRVDKELRRIGHGRGREKTKPIWQYCGTKPIPPVRRGCRRRDVRNKANLGELGHLGDGAWQEGPNAQNEANFGRSFKCEVSSVKCGKPGGESPESGAWPFLRSARVRWRRAGPWRGRPALAWHGHPFDRLRAGSAREALWHRHPFGKLRAGSADDSWAGRGPPTRNFALGTPSPCHVGMPATPSDGPAAWRR